METSAHMEAKYIQKGKIKLTALSTHGKAASARASRPNPLWPSGSTAPVSRFRLATRTATPALVS